MRYRSTLLLLAVALGLGLFLYLYEIRGREAREAAEQAERRLLSFEREAVTALELPLEGEGRARVVRAAGGEDAPARWRLETPLEFPADTDEVDRILSALEELESKGSFDAPDDLAPFGLGGDRVEVRVFAGDAEGAALYVGGDAPVGGHAYAALGGEPDQVYTVERWRATALRPQLKRLRDARLTALDDADVTAFRLSAAGELVAAGERVEAETEDAEADWRLVEPVEARADAPRVRRLLQDLALARAREFIDEPEDPAGYGLDAPAFEVALEAGGSRETLAFGRAGDKAYARGSGREVVYEVADTLVDDLPTAAFALRHKRVLDVDAAGVHRFELEFPRDDASRAFALEAGDWTSAEDLPVKPFAARDLIAELSELDAVGIREASFEPAALGLEPPLVRAVLRDADGNPLATLALGDPEGDEIPATAPPAPEVWRLHTDISRYLPFGLEAFQNRWLEEEEEETEAADPEPADPGPDPAEAPAP